MGVRTQVSSAKTALFMPNLSLIQSPCFELCLQIKTDKLASCQQSA